MNWDELDNSPQAIRSFLSNEGIGLKKRWGQNFMISADARARIVALLEPRAHEVVWEVGPGLGAITALLLSRAQTVVLFEIDYGIIRVLRERFGDSLRIVPGDAVETIGAWLPGDVPPPDCVAGNLPYSSAAPILAALLHSPAAADCRRMVFTVQREMAQRMVASPGTSDYSPLSVLALLAGAVRLHGDLAGGSFYPRPEVRSTIVSIAPVSGSLELRRLASVAARALFEHRRKTIRNNVPGLARALRLPQDTVTDCLLSAGIDPALRAEVIPPSAYRSLAEALKKYGASP